MDLWEAEQRIREGRRKPTSSEKILKALEVAGNIGLFNYQLQEVSGSLSWHRRIGDLRVRGHNIECIKITKGRAKYVLHGSEKR